MASVAGFIEEWENDSPYITAFTSGSTGVPKEIRLLKADMISSATATNKFFGITETSALALPLSIEYIAGKMMVVRAITAGCTLLELPVSNNILIDRDVDLLSIVPTQLESVLKIKNAKQRIHNLLIGGAPLSTDQEKSIADSGIRAWLGYGMTETCSHVALRRIGHDETFHAMPGVTFSLDERNCLVVHSERFSWKTLITNDVAELISPSAFIWIGRADNIINSGGLKLQPEMIEKTIRISFPDLAPFYITSEPDPVLGNRLVMVGECIPISFLDLLKKAIPDHKILPKRIITVQKLPQLSNGKIKRLHPSEIF